MKLTRTDKEQLVSEMSGAFQSSKAVLMVNFQGLKVKEVEALKKELRKAGIGFQIAKNTLFKIALKNAGISIDEKLLDQPIAIIWGEGDEVLPAKLTVNFAKQAENLKLVGGFINREFIELNQVKALAALPGRDELLAKLVGSLNAPMYRLVNALQGNLRSLVYILNQYQQQKA